MDYKTFDDVLKDQMEKCFQILGKKAGEYANDEDRFHNFKVAGELQGCTPETALGGMLAKHVVSVFDLIRDIDELGAVNLAVWEEKLGDALNYLFLLKGLVVERSINSADFLTKVVSNDA